MCHALEVEVDSLEQLEEALGAGVKLVLLDNMDARRRARAVALVAGRAVVEVSGSVKLEDVRASPRRAPTSSRSGALTTRAAWIDSQLGPGVRRCCSQST